MTIKDAILAAHPDATATAYNYKDIYIADFSERTGNVRSVEVTCANQLCPISGMPMDSAVFHNPKRIRMEIVQYDDYKFLNLKGHNIQHCEATMFPSGEIETKWVVMLELKDCKPNKIKKHRAKAIRQIYNVVKDLRDRAILTKLNFRK